MYYPIIIYGVLQKSYAGRRGLDIIIKGLVLGSVLEDIHPSDNKLSLEDLFFSSRKRVIPDFELDLDKFVNNFLILFFLNPLLFLNKFQDIT
jgi:hypothetical protein